MRRLMTDEEAERAEYFRDIVELSYQSINKLGEFELTVKKTKYDSILSKIHGTKQREIGKLLVGLDYYKDFFKGCKIIAFGSVVSGRCREFSDIDLCISIPGVEPTSKDYRRIVDDLYSLLGNVLVSEYDLLEYEELSNKNYIFKEVNEEGVILWKT